MANNERSQKIFEAASERAKRQGSVTDQVSFYKNLPKDQLYSIQNTSITMPKGPKDQMQNPDDPWGKPEGWDYNTAKTGWKNEELPPGAIGWKPDGTAWYGGENAWDEWKKSWKVKVDMPGEMSGDDYWDQAKQKLGQVGEYDGIAANVGGLFSGIGDVFNALGNYKMKGGETPTGLAKTSRVVGQLFQGAGALLGRGAELAEKYVFAPIQALEDIANAGDVGLEMSPDSKKEQFAEDIKSGWLSQVKNSFIDGAKFSERVSEAYLFLANLADIVVPTHVLWNGIRAAVSPITWDEKRDIFKERVRAGEVLYSSFIEPSIKQSYLDKVKEGRHPYLVALEVQKPFAEMAGQSILDPLNLIGLLSKGNKAVGSVDNYLEYMGKPKDNMIEFFEAGEKGLEVLNKEADLTRMAEKVIEGRTTASKLLDNLSIELNVKGKGPLGFIRPKINRALEKSGIFSWSNSGKRHHLNRLASDMMHTIVSTVGKDPDEALDIVKYMVQLQSDNVDEVAEAIAYLGGSKMPLNVVMSEGGERFGAIFREVLLDADGVQDAEGFIKSIDKIKDPLELKDFFDKKIDKVAQRLFPDLKKRAQVLGKIEEGTELTKAEMLIGNTPLTGGEKFFLKAEQLADNKFLTSINGFFANVYMGLSPGYAFRNLWTNEFHLLVDMGVGDYIQSWAKFNPRVAEKNLEYMTRSSVGQLADIGIGQGGKAGKPLIGKLLAGKAEQMSGRRAYGMAYKDTVEKILPKIFEKIAPQLRAAGATDDQIRIYQQVARATYGRFDEAGEALAQAMKAGQISLFETAGWMPDDLSKFFKNYKLDDEIMDIIRNSGGLSVDEVQKKVRTLYEEVRDYIRTTENQISFPSMDEYQGLDGFEHVDEIMTKLDDLAMMSDDVKASTKHFSQQNRITDQRYQDALTETTNLFNEQMKAAGKNITVEDILDKMEDQKLAQAIQDVRLNKYYNKPHEFYRQKIYTPIETWVRRLSPGSDYMKKRSFQEALEQAWKELPFFRGEPPPKNISYQQFRDLLYDVVLPSETVKHYAPLRDAHSSLATVLYDALQKEGLQPDKSLIAMWERAQTQLKRARTFDTHIIRNVSYDDLGRATGDIINNISLSTERYTDVMRTKKLAAVNGIATGYFDPKQNRTIPTNHLLKKINEALENFGIAPYEHLDEIPFDQAESAIRSIKGKDFQPIFKGPSPTKVEIPPVFQDIYQSALDTAGTTQLKNMDARLQNYVKAVALDMAYGLDTIAGPGMRYKMYPNWWKTAPIDLSKLSLGKKRGGKAVVQALYDLAEGKDGTTRIYNELREYILKNRIGLQRTDKFYQEPAQQLYYEMRRLMQTYSPEPSALDDVLPDIVDNIPTQGAGSAIMSAEEEARILNLRPGEATADDINFALSEVFDSFEINADDDFWNGAVKVPSPEFFSDPHAYLSAAPEISSNFQQLMNLIAENHGKMQDVYDNPALAEALVDIQKLAASQETTMRLAANEFATANRNFALVNYDSRRNIDTLTGLLMPYQYWYSRTYPNWARRVASNPAILANYSRYKESLAQIHAGLPEYWQQNINSYELLGLFPDNPLYYNLEQTLNPLQGLTNVDFEDPYKRVDAWSRTLDDLNRFGPTTNPIYSFMTAFGYLISGENEAASRWGGRLIPQTNTLKSVLSLMGAKPYEIDPAVWLFSGGVDPYERRRTGRAFPAMIEERQLTAEQAIDAAWTQQGPYWEQARQRAVGERAWGQLSSFLLGVGFKARNKGDMQTDMMYDEFFSLMNQRASMTPDVFKQEMNRLSTTYPFMDSVLISAKTGWARDLSFAYAILDRIPPGDTNRLYEMAGIDKRLVERFYESRGDFEEWPESDRQRFMSGVIDINAMLAIPDEYTSQDWTNAKAEYSKMTQAMKEQFSEDIEDRIDYYYQLTNAGKRAEAEMYLQKNKDVELAMEWKTSRIVESPLMQPYYSGLSKINGYYFGQMYNEADKKFPGIDQIQDDYYNIPYDDYAEKRRFKRENPMLEEYWEWREEQSKIANQKVIDMASKLPEGLPATFRDDAYADELGIGAQDIEAGLTAPEDSLAEYTDADWREFVGTNDFSAVYQYLDQGTSLEYKTRTRLTEVADELGITLNRLIQYIGLSLQD